MSDPEKPTANPAESASSTGSPDGQNIEQIEKVITPKEENTDSEHDIANSTASDVKVDNILKDFTEEEVMAKGRAYALSYGLDPELFARAAAVARSPTEFRNMSFLYQDEVEALDFESKHKWRAVPKRLYHVIAMCSVAAAVQGMDESVTNGANLFWPAALGIGGDSDRDSWLLGLVNSAPYLCCAVIGCWLTDPINHYFGRKGAIFITCFISLWACFWQGFVDSWYHLFVARFFLGFGIGPKSATVPVYAAETTPANIRGALVMMWQLWTAFGIMLGTTFSLAFFYVDNADGSSGLEFAAKTNHMVSKGLNWRLMLASALIPAIFVCIQVLYCPESPRWLMGKDRHNEAYQSYSVLRKHKILAARDCFYQYCLFVEEVSYNEGRNIFWKIKEMLTKRRNRNAAVGAFIVMFMQQFCGINVIAYYSSSIFSESGFDTIESLLASWGFGMINTVFALPAVFTIDTFGRKFLLMLTFPLMAIFLLVAGFAFWIPETSNARIGIIAFGVYMFTAIYSSGEGPVPFTYSAEVFPLYIRDVGMSFATATCWFFNFVLAITWPSLKRAFKPQGAFGWYAAWNFVGFFLVFLFLRETKGYTLEELDYIFDVPMPRFAAHEVHRYLRKFEIHILRRKLPQLPPLHAKAIAATHNLDEKAVGKHIDVADSA